MKSAPFSASPPRPGPARPRRSLILLQAAVTVGALAWVFRDPATRSRFATLWLQLQPAWLAAALACAGGSLVLSWLRWRLFLSVQGLSVPTGRLVRIGLVGAFFDLLLPGTAGGDAVRAVMLCRDHPGRKAPVLLSLAADHMSGLLPLGLLALVFVRTRRDVIEASPIGFTASVWIGCFIVGSLLGMGLCALLARDSMLRLMPHRFPGRAAAGRFAEVVRRFSGNRRCWLAAAGLSLAMFLLHFTVFFAAARALGAAVPWSDVMALMPIVDVVTMIPASLSGLGVRETLFEDILTRLASLPSGVAAAISLTGFACQAAWGLPGAFVFPSGRRASPAPVAAAP